MREVVGVTTRRLDGPRRCTTQPPQLIGNAAESFKPGYLELSPEILERLLSTDNIEDHYEVEELPFARGKYATVRRCRHRKSGQQFAAKYLKKRRRSTDLRYEILHEVAVLHACAQCPRIVNLYQIFETAHEMIIVLELAPGGELQMLLDNDQIPAERTVKRFMRQILDGLEFLHSINVAHLDIKPQNLVLTSEFPGCDVKLCDFGISRYIGENADIREILGTPDYVAPEVLNYEAISLSTDMWSVGVLLYVLLTGCSPFGGDTKQETFCNISQCRLDFPDDLFEDISYDAQDLMKRLMVKESSLRLTATECLQHPWFQTTDLPKSVPCAPCQPEATQAAAAANISDVLVRTTDSPRKIADPSVKRQSSIKRQEMTRKTIECVRGKGEAPPKIQLFTKTPEVSRRTLPAPDKPQRLSDVVGNKENNPKLAEKPRKHSFNESFRESGSVREKSRKLSGERGGAGFENRRQTSMRDLTRRSSVELLVSSISSKKKQNSFRESMLRGSESATDVRVETTPKTAEEEEEEGVRSRRKERGEGEDGEDGAKARRQKLRENLTNLAKKFEEGEGGLRDGEPKFFAKTDEGGKAEGEVAGKKAALPSQTLPIHPMFHRASDKIFKCKRIFIDDELGSSGSATILIPVNSGQSSMSSISGGSSETSSITSDTVSEMSVDSGGDCSSFVSSDDSLDCGAVYKSVWESSSKTGKVWARECKGSFERALSRFNLEQGGDGVTGSAAAPAAGTRAPAQRRYQKNSYGGLAKRSLCTSSPILNKIGNLSNFGGSSTDCKKYGVQLMKEGSGNLVIIREVKAGRYTKFSEVKCESVQSRIRKLQDQTWKS